MLRGWTNNIMAESIFVFALFLSPYFVVGDIISVYPGCYPVGTKSITISWIYEAQPGSSPDVFYVLFCKNTNDCSNTSTNYNLGCAVNVTEKKSNYSCDIGKALNLQFPPEYSFNYYIKEDNDLPVKARCPVNMLIQGSKPTGLKLETFGEGQLKLSWSKPTDMGKFGQLLCYFIEYFIEGSPEKKFTVKYEDEDKHEFVLKSLLPYKKYYVYLQCALTCAQKKSLAAGPVSATTLEEKPQGQITIQDWKETPVQLNQRNVTVILKIPDKEKWNGKVKQIRVLCYLDEILCTSENITLEEQPSSDGQQHQRQYKVTFPFLRMDKVYYITADYCNSVGCSQLSRNQTIERTPISTDVVKVENSTDKEDLTTTQVVGIVVGLAFFLIIAIIILFLIKKYCCNASSNRTLNDEVGPLDDFGSSEPQQQAEVTDDVYARADRNAVRKITLNPETIDFQSASVRSLISSNSISGLNDQSALTANSIPEEGSNQESVGLLQNSSFHPMKHRPSPEDNGLLPTPV